MKRKQNFAEFSVQKSDAFPELPLKMEIVAIEAQDSINPICHLCLCKSENSQPLFEKSSTMVLENIKMVFQIEPIQDEALPDQICTHCIDKIDDFIAFRQMVLENHEKLQLEIKGAKQLSVFEPFINMKEDEDEKEVPSKVPSSSLPIGDNPLSTEEGEEAVEPRNKKDEQDNFLRTFFNFDCPECSQPFSRFRELRYHARTKHKINDLMVPCSQHGCKKSFNSRQKLIIHLRAHEIRNTPAPRFECNECGAICRSRSGIYNHLKKGHQKREQPTETSFKCSYCSVEFMKKDPLRQHMRISHNFVINHTYICSQCPKSFNKRFRLTRHVRAIHERADEVICDLCAKVCLDKYALKYHMDHHHGKTAKIACQICGKLLYKKVIKLHMRLHELQPAECEICSKVFQSRDQLLRHKRSIHQAPRHICKHCGKGFNKPNRLKEHMTTHAIGGDLYQCEWCFKKFNFSSSMSLHKKTQHPVEWLQTRSGSS